MPSSLAKPSSTNAGWASTSQKIAMPVQRCQVVRRSMPNARSTMLRRATSSSCSAIASAR